MICYVKYCTYYKYEIEYKNDDTTLFLGSRYILLRQSFLGLPGKIVRKDIQRVLLISGGTDNCNAISKLLKMLLNISIMEIIVICGVFNYNYNELIKMYSNYSNVQIIKSVQNIEQYMLEADLVISAGGTTLYEICATGTPAISYSIADNQINNVKNLMKMD